MPQRIRDLIVEEISLCDKGANPGAVIALAKRDASDRARLSALQDRVTILVDDTQRSILTAANHRGNLHEFRKKEKPKMGIIKKCLLAIDGGTVRKAGLKKSDFAEALERMASKKGRTMDQALLSEKGQKLYAAYCNAPDEEPAVEKRMRPATEAEGMIEDKAQKLRKKNPGMSMAQARAKAWDDNPDLYAQHEKQVANGLEYQVPASTEYLQLPLRGAA